MLHQLGNMIDRFDWRLAGGPELAAEQLPIAIRHAHDDDVPRLHDLAELDSAEPLEGPVLVAVVDRAIWAALGLDDDRVVADPFLPTAAAAELLRLRVRQLRSGSGRPTRRLLARRILGRA
ncbi:MAG TPA: hypothetical protein VG474_06880 [Solirubrobacteraceae bacterium]|nr:hypothetical protein [Solirubrobacteraceae bacterium]